MPPIVDLYAIVQAVKIIFPYPLAYFVPFSYIIYVATKQTRITQMTTITQKRAKKGGQIAVNGEFYEGGKFLPSTQKAKGKPYKKTGKREIEPYKWEMQPTTESVTIWSQINAFCKWDGTELTVNDNAQFDGENYFYPEYASINAKILTRLIKMFNDGVRWIDF